MQHLADADLIIGSPSLRMTYNDFDLTVSVRYQGALLSLPNVGVRKHFSWTRNLFPMAWAIL